MSPGLGAGWVAIEERFYLLKRRLEREAALVV
jgi:hypothetical protein